MTAELVSAQAAQPPQWGNQYDRVQRDGYKLTRHHDLHGRPLVTVGGGGGEGAAWLVHSAQPRQFLQLQREGYRSVLQ